MHSHVIGHDSKVALLDESVRDIRRHKEVWVVTHEANAREAAEVLKVFQ